MATGKIVTYVPESRTYALPAEHAAVLTKAAGPGNMATFARMIPILSKVEPGIVDSFRHGGGVFYDQFHDFMALWASVNEQTFERTLVPKVLPLMPEVASALRAGIDVLDIGCGEGHSTNLLAQAHPHGSGGCSGPPRPRLRGHGRASAQEYCAPGPGVPSGGGCRLGVREGASRPCPSRQAVDRGAARMADRIGGKFLTNEIAPAPAG